MSGEPGQGQAGLDIKGEVFSGVEGQYNDWLEMTGAVQIRA